MNDAVAAFKRFADLEYARRLDQSSSRDRDAVAARDHRFGFDAGTLGPPVEVCAVEAAPDPKLLPTAG